jgi:hypothetical protein
VESQESIGLSAGRQPRGVRTHRTEQDPAAAEDRVLPETSEWRNAVSRNGKRVWAPRGARLSGRSKALKGEPHERHRPEKGRKPAGGASRRGRVKRRGRNEPRVGPFGNVDSGRSRPLQGSGTPGRKPSRRQARRRRSSGHTLEGRPSLWEQPGPWPRTVFCVEDLAAGGTAGREPRTKARLDVECGSSERQGKPTRGGASPATAVRNQRLLECLEGDHQAQLRCPCENRMVRKFRNIFAGNHPSQERARKGR